jgi:hypothetical protein
VGGGDFIVSGILDGNKHVVYLDTSNLPSAVADYFSLVEPPEDKFARLETGDMKTESLAEARVFAVPFGGVTLPAKKTPVTPPAATQPQPTATPPEPSGSTETPKKNPTSGPSTTQEVKAPTTQATFESSNEAGPPVIKLNDTFSIVYQPDFDENYVINVSSPFGTGSADVALKYGWMIEHAKWNVDNSEIGKFIEQQVQTAEAVGLSFIDPLAGASAAGVLESQATSARTKTAPQQVAERVMASYENFSAVSSSTTKPITESTTTPEVTRQHPFNALRTDRQEARVAVKDGQTRVLLRVRFVLMAEPGLYPFLKPRESTATWWNAHVYKDKKRSKEAKAKSDPDTATEPSQSPDAPAFKKGDMPRNQVLLPFQPYTVVAYNYQRMIQVELVTGNPTTQP